MDCATILGVRAVVIRVRVTIWAIRARTVLMMLSAPVVGRGRVAWCDALAISQRRRYPRLW